MKIISLQAENIKRIRAVEIRPDGNLVEITGRNRQGKTSILDSIMWAVGGKRVIQTEPIRKGAERARIRLDVGEYLITRTFERTEEGTDYTTSLKVERADGTRVKKEQDVLTSFLGALTFDPLNFVDMTPAEQFDLMKQFVSDVDFVEIAKADEKDREARRVAKIRADDLRAQAAAIILPAGNVPRRVDIAALEAALSEASGTNSLIERRKAKREGAEAEIEKMVARAAALRVEADQVDQHAQALRDELAQAGPLPELVAIDELVGALNAARAGNVVADKAANKAAVEAQAQAKEDEVDALTKAIKAREVAKQKAISESAMPVPGIEFGDKMIRLNGEPFDQASDAEQLQASVAIAAAMSPELRIIRVREGSKMDPDALAWLGQFADEHDMQVWVETVAGNAASAFVIEDGRLASDEPAVDDGECV